MLDHYLTVGRIGRPYGVKGFFKVNSYTDPFDNILKYSPWQVLFRQQFIPLVECKPHGNFIIGKLENCHSPEEVKKYTNSPIMILRTQLPELKKEEFYWTDLIGLEVYNLTNKYLGKVTEMLETGANDILVVDNKILIPYVLKKYIMNIDLNKKQMIVDWEEEWLR